MVSINATIESANEKKNSWQIRRTLEWYGLPVDNFKGLDSMIIRWSIKSSYAIIILNMKADEYYKDIGNSYYF